ncbi:MAG TPA: O-antigen polymerase [Terriglobales bacterium]|nr:O-antigen polymerase [Terriglobales bacterium]
MNTLLLSINCFAVLLVSLYCFKRRPFKLLDPTWAFIGGYFINYCVRPALFLIDPELGSAYARMFGTGKILHGFSGTLIFAMLGLAGFAIGNLAAPNLSRKLSRTLPSFSLEKLFQSKSLPWIAFTFLACGWIGLRSFLSVVGWTGSMLLLLQGGERGEFSEATFGHGNFTFAAQLSLVGWALIFAYWVKTPLPKTTGGRLARRFTQVIWFLLTVTIWAAFGERSTLLAVLFVPLALRYSLHQKTKDSDQARALKAPLRKLVISISVLVFLVAGPLGLIFKGTEASPAAAVSLSISAWDAFEFTVLAQSDLRARDLHYGSTYLQDVFYSWLPRSLFPSKPTRYGIVVVQDQLAPELQDNEGATFPPGILVEAYSNFGYIGLFLIPLLIGIFCHALYFNIYRDNTYWIVLLSFLFANLASFRGFGGFLALLLAYGTVLFVVIKVALALETMRSFFIVQPRELPDMGTAHGV